MKKFKFPQKDPALALHVVFRQDICFWCYLSVCINIKVKTIFIFFTSFFLSTLFLECHAAKAHIDVFYSELVFVGRNFVVF